MEGKAKPVSVSMYQPLIDRLDQRRGSEPRSAQIQEDLQVYWQVMDAAMAGVRRLLTRDEVSLVLDAMNGSMWITPGQPISIWLGTGDQDLRSTSVSGLVANVSDAITLDGYDRKWKIDGTSLIDKLKSLDRLATLAIVDWCQVMWRNHANDDFWDEEISRFAPVE